MANVRDSDTSLWLHNKLGTSNDSWTGGSICSQLNAEVLRNIKECFPDLQTQVKLKLLLSFFHIPRRNVAEWKSELEEILEVALIDSEQWVSMLAEMMKTYPATGTLNTNICELEENKRIFSDLVNDLKKLVRKQNDLGMLPLECHYLNKSALVSSVGQQSGPPKHFTLKRKPKSAALRAELMQKSADAASNLKKSAATTVPVRSRGMPRKMTDTTPLKGIPSRVPDGGGFRSLPTASPVLPRGPSIRKDGGIKLLDITEQPIGYAQAKKRKRMQELEDAKRAAELAQAAQPATQVTAAPATPATPDYAAGLTPLNPPTPLQPPATPGVYAPPTPSNPMTVTTPIKEPTTNVSATPPVSIKTEVIMTSPQTPSSVASTIVQPQSHLVTHQQLSQQQPQPQHQQQQQQQSQIQQPQPQPQLTTLTQVSSAQTSQLQASTPQQTQPTVQNVIFRSPHITQLTIAPPSISQQTNLALTREQMIEAQEMFQTANKVTRPEKALILGFMAGSRENPCPQLGNIVTIKLSENLENVLQQDKTYLTMLVETHFQMNYNTGEWKRIKKFRNIDANQLAQQRAAAAAAAAAQAAAQANHPH
ncbi:unnamed protein product [Bemisia tabaci]|uniref:HDAg domain-containing protein n=1 Tax=Bemisia tabaci TaxID=7038 RepID=A0A9P0AKI2_BEMTA|nr:PREDICTED: negative elongation factor A [Bemisia tabaci]CAH0395090.1 unnamed protein product [Bemisia tabaci]